MRVLRDGDGVHWLTVADASARYGISERTIRTWRARGKVRGARMGEGLMVCAVDVARAEHATRGKYQTQRRK